MSQEERYECLRLEHQLCFPLYACSKEIVRRYKPFLDELDLTYTQYLVMMVLWEGENIGVKELGKRLLLDSGTLTPVLKSLESKGFVQRVRDRSDERALLLRLTESGKILREKAIKVPPQISACLPLSSQEASTLYALLYKVIGSFASEE